MGLFNRRAPWTFAVSKETEPEGAKAAEFTPMLVHTIRSGQWPWGSYGAMYRRQPAVRAVVDFLARNIAQLNPKVYERVGNTDRLEVGDHPLATLLRHPNPATTRYAHLRDTVSDIAIYDRAYWRKVQQGNQRAIARIAPSKLHAETVEGRTVYRTPDGKTIPRDQLVIFHGYSPDGDDQGVSPLETLRRVLQEEAAAQENREGMWRNAARQSGAIERPIDAPTWSPEARERFRADWESTMTGGNNAGRTAILEEGMTWNAASFSPKDTEYIAGRRLTYEEVAIQYGIHPGLVGFITGAQGAVEAHHRQLYQDTLGPWLRMMQDEFELQLLPWVEPFNANRTVYVEFNLAEKLKGSFEEQQKALATAVGVPHMSINEGRAKVNLPRIDEVWADTPVQPLNVMYGGQPATTVPTEVPGQRSSEPRQKKAAPPGAIRRRDAAAKAHAELLTAFFERQEASVVSALGGKANGDRARWDRELTADLYTLSLRTTTENGQRAARQIRGVYDENRTRDYLLENARTTAESVNESTFSAVDEAEDIDAVRHVYEVAKTSRAETLGLSLATTLIAFARTEAAKHSQDADGRQRMKTWVVTNQNSRHPQMDGESVPVGDVFSNGARWPGDAVLGADGAAGCRCLLDLA